MKQTKFGINGVNWEEQLEAKHFLNLSRLKELIQIIAPAHIDSYIKANDYGVVSLASGTSEFRISSVVNFILNPETTHEHDLVAIAFLIPALLKAAQLVRSVKDPNQQILILQASIDRIVPGAGRQGQFFVIELAQYIQQVIIKEHLVEISA